MDKGKMESSGTPRCLSPLDILRAGVCAVAMSFAFAAAVIYYHGAAWGIRPLTNLDFAAGVESGLFSSEDLGTYWNPSQATRVSLSGRSGRVSGLGAEFQNNELWIYQAGTYILSGELDDGSVVVQAKSGDKVWIFLENATIHRENSAAVRVEQAGKVFLTLPEGSENKLSCGSEFSSESMESGISGAVYSKDKLTVNGGGSLEVEAAYGHGIVCNDDFALTGGAVTIRAVKDGIHAHESARFTGADMRLTIYAGLAKGCQGISANSAGMNTADGEEKKPAFIYIGDGSVSIEQCYEGMEAVKIEIAGGTVSVCPYDDGLNASEPWPGRPVPNSRAFRNAAEIRVSGGSVTVENKNGYDSDGFDSNGSVFIDNGTVRISTGNGRNDGSVAVDYGNGVFEVNGGDIIACGDTRMLEPVHSNSRQASILYALSGAVSSRTSVALRTPDGQTLLSWDEVPNGFRSVLFSSPQMQVGETYIVDIGGTMRAVPVQYVNTYATYAASPSWPPN